MTPIQQLTEIRDEMCNVAVPERHQFIPWRRRLSLIIEALEKGDSQQSTEVSGEAEQAVAESVISQASGCMTAQEIRSERERLERAAARSSFTPGESRGKKEYKQFFGVKVSNLEGIHFPQEKAKLVWGGITSFPPHKHSTIELDPGCEYLVAVCRLGPSTNAEEAEQAGSTAEPSTACSCREPLPSQPDPGRGYRLLGPDEVIREGDEYWNGAGWMLSTARGGNAGWSLRYRRKVEPQVWEACTVLENDGIAEFKSEGDYPFKSGQRVWVSDRRPLTFGEGE